MGHVPITLNALLVSKVFVESTAKRQYAYAMHKQLGLPRSTIRKNLAAMMDMDWIVREEEITEGGFKKVYFRITEYGLAEAITTFAQLQLTRQLVVNTPQAIPSSA